jgi:hypothetical protein
VWRQVQTAVQLVLETRPQGGSAGGGTSREDIVDKLCEELLSKVKLCKKLPTVSSVQCP